MVEAVSHISWLYTLPLWLCGLTFIAIFLGAIELGFRTGRKVYRTKKEAAEAVPGDVTVSALLALLGLLLAFTYAFGLSRYDHRRVAVVEEVNALGTAFLRADFLPEPGRSELRRSLLNYARTRLVTWEMVSSREELKQTLGRTLEAQSGIWPAARKALSVEADGAVKVAVMAAVNEVLDVHSRRMAAGLDFIPAVVLVLLVLVSALSLGVAIQNAASQGQTSRWRMTAFALVLLALILIIMDFDSPQRGIIRGNPGGMAILIAQMEAALAD